VTDVHGIQEAGDTREEIAEPPAVTPYEPEVAYPDASPVRYDVTRQGEYARWLPLVKWLLAAPHAIALLFIEIGLLITILVSAVAVLVTGRYPRGLFQFMVGGARWLLRVTAYLYLLTDAYPPFALYDQPSYPVRFDLDYPPDGRVSRWRALLAWVLVLPQLVALPFIYIGVYLMILLALFSILFTRMFPPGVFDFVVRVLRFHSRVNAYALFMTERYPRFKL
jgi:hypothetical protein